MPFHKKFFSKKEQQRRIQNVQGVLRAVFSRKTSIKATTSSKTLNKVLELGANHPFQTAGLAVAGLTVVGRTAVKAVATKASSAFSGARFGTQAKIAGAALVGIPLVATSARVRSVIGQAPKAPGKIAKFGSDLGSFIDKPSKETAKTLITENKLVAGLLAGGAAVIAAPAIAAGAGAVIAGRQRAETTKAVAALGAGSFTSAALPVVPKAGDSNLVGVPVSGLDTPISSTEVTGGAPTPKTRTPTKRARRKRPIARRAQSQNVKIINVNQSTS